MARPRLRQPHVAYEPGSAEHLAHVSATAKFAAAWPEGPTAHALVAWLYGVTETTAHRYLREARQAHPDTPRMRKERTRANKKEEQ